MPTILSQMKPRYSIGGGGTGENEADMSFSYFDKQMSTNWYMEGYKSKPLKKAAGVAGLCNIYFLW